VNKLEDSEDNLYLGYINVGELAYAFTYYYLCSGRNAAVLEVV
jgi:hypothetical protein